MNLGGHIVTKQELINELMRSKEFLDRSTGVLTEEDSALTPADGMMTAAQQLAHIAQTVDWFVDGAFGEAFDLDFEGAAKQVATMTSLESAGDWCNRAYENAIETIGAKSDEELAELTPEGPIMGGTPKGIVLAGIVDHTAHHRGALTVYARLAGKVPAMPYV